MTVLNKQVSVPYTPMQMYDLVDQVEHYPVFVPGCAASEVLSRSADQVHASLTFSGAGVEQSFTTINTLKKGESIEVTLDKGPFKYLDGSWRFEPDAQGCLISLSLDYRFSNRLLAMLFGKVFDQVAEKLVDSFIKRAKVMYPNEG